MNATLSLTGKNGITAELFQDLDAEWPIDGVAPHVRILSTQAKSNRFPISAEYGSAAEARLARIKGASVLAIDVVDFGSGEVKMRETRGHFNDADAWIIAEDGYGDAEGWRAECQQVLDGDVYGYVVTLADGTQGDSCWGFFGLEYAEEQAREAMDFAAEAEDACESFVGTAFAL